MNVANMLGSIGFVGMCVMGFLLGLSIYSVSVILDKYRRFRAATSQSLAFLPEFRRPWSAGKTDGSRRFCQCGFEARSVH